MLRRTEFAFYRKGPSAADLMPFLTSMPYQPEREMLKTFHGAGHEIPYRRKYQQKFKGYRINGVPRDVGEIPRKYLLRYLFLHQPITLEGLWEVLKKQKDVPVDSMRHMRSVLRIARDEDWVYIEKDQDSNEMIIRIKPEKCDAVQALVQEQSEADRVESEKAISLEKNQLEEKDAERKDIEDAYLENIHRELVEVAEKLKKHDPKAFYELPYVTETGGYDFFWYGREKAQAVE